MFYPYCLDIVLDLTNIGCLIYGYITQIQETRDIENIRHVYRHSYTQTWTNSCRQFKQTLKFERLERSNVQRMGFNSGQSSS